MNNFFYNRKCINQRFLKQHIQYFKIMFTMHEIEADIKYEVHLKSKYILQMIQ